MLPAGAIIELLRYINYTMNSLDEFSTWMFLLALIGSAVMAWAGWRELQSEGGTRVLGGSSSPGTPAAAAVAPSEAERPAAPVAPVAAAEHAPVTTRDSIPSSDEDSRPGG